MTYNDSKGNLCWLDEKIVSGLTRNDLLLIAVAAVLVITLYCPLDWDWVFGLRTK